MDIGLEGLLEALQTHVEGRGATRVSALCCVACDLQGFVTFADV